jgi:hypothetical protein
MVAHATKKKKKEKKKKKKKKEQTQKDHRVTANCVGRMPLKHIMQPAQF